MHPPEPARSHSGGMLEHQNFAITGSPVPVYSSCSMVKLGRAQGGHPMMGALPRTNEAIHFFDNLTGRPSVTGG